VLTNRQAQIIALYASGYNAHAIGKREFLSVHTVRSHLSDIRERLGARSLCNAIALSVARGIIEYDPQITAFVAVDRHMREELARAARA
jgi:DNA-binding CsgD family transcriptional regulator